MAAARLVEFLQYYVACGGGLSKCAQHIQAHDIARSLPDGIDRHLADHACERQFFGVTVAAQHLHGFGGQCAAAFADPEFRGGRERAAQCDLAVDITVEGARQAHCHRAGGLRFDRQIGKHALHQRLIDQQRAEGLAVACMVQRLNHRLAHHSCRAGDAVEASVSAHFEDGRNAAAFFAH